MAWVESHHHHNNSLPPPSSEILSYSIAGCSAYSGRYAPQNIQHDNPRDSNSRWSGAPLSTEPQWVLLKLDNVSVVQSITFGKYFKSHPCNTKEFKVLMGISEENLTEVLHDSLRDDKDPETFRIQHRNSQGVFLPSQFIKIVPVSAHNARFHMSIWFVSLSGIAETTFLDQVTASFEKHSETMVLRHVLKYLRQKRLLTPYEDIVSRSGMRFEHPLVSQLFHHLVVVGDWPKVEELIHEMGDQGLFDDYLRRRHPDAIWTPLADGGGERPSPRGGHAMCMDQASRTIYLFGGFDGRNLDDFWAYDIASHRWRNLSLSTAADQGPGPRACHKMVFDPKTGKIYVIGNLEGENEHGGGGGGGGSGTASFVSDFYCYHTTGPSVGKWDLLAQDTASSGGPPKVYDHQMVMDSDARMIYVFGGRVSNPDWNHLRLSGFYSYNLKTSKWRHLQSSSSPASVSIPLRFGHSMVLEPVSRKLFIFGGQREDVYLSDMYSYDIATNTAVKLAQDSGLPSCFSHKAVLDPRLREMYVFCGLVRDSQPGGSTIIPSDSATWLFSYDPLPGKMLRINFPEYDQDNTPTEIPQARFAHQVVYDIEHQTVYMHGGNGGIPGEPLEKTPGDTDPRTREKSYLGDFWSMRLRRPSLSEVIRRCICYYRQQQFAEMCSSQPPHHCLMFLQTQVYQVVDHSDPAESEAFRGLLKHLVSPTPRKFAPSSPPPTSTAMEEDDDCSEQRPRKRSKSDLWSGEERGITPQASWDVTTTSTSSTTTSPSVNAHLFQQIEDPLEKALRKSEKSGSCEVLGNEFEQRNHVFEQIMEFVSSSAKQPSSNLQDLIGLRLVT